MEICFSCLPASSVALENQGHSGSWFCTGTVVFLRDTFSIFLHTVQKMSWWYALICVSLLSFIIIHCTVKLMGPFKIETYFFVLRTFPELFFNISLHLYFLFSLFPWMTIVLMLTSWTKLLIFLFFFSHSSHLLVFLLCYTFSSVELFIYNAIFLVFPESFIILWFVHVFQKHPSLLIHY